MRENDVNDIFRRIKKTFSDPQYINRLSKSRKNWLMTDVSIVIKDLQEFLESL